MVEVLAEFEEKLPNIGTKIFEPDRSVMSFNLQKINLEVSRMLRFMNIGQYVPLVRIEDLSKKSAVGLAYIGGYGDKAIEQTISLPLCESYPRINYFCRQNVRTFFRCPKMI